MPCQHPPFFESYLLLLLPTVPYFFCSFHFTNFLSDTQKNNTLGIHIRWFMAVTWLFFFVSYFFHFFLILFIEHSIQYIYPVSYPCLWLFFMLISFFLRVYAEKIERKRKGKKKVILTTPTLALFPSIYRNMWAWEQ